MTDISIQLDRLKSTNKNKRYDACEELRVASDLPPEAISALEAASNDPEPDVADAARRALQAHQQVETDSISTSADSEVSAEPEIPEVNEVASLYKSIRVWTISSLIFGGISIFASGTFNPGWGIVMIVIGILSWKIKTPAMFVIYGVMIGWAAVMNGLVVLQGEEIWLLVLALLQVYWTVSIAKQYRKYRHLRLRELYEAGNWPGNLTPPADQAVISCRFAIASTSLAGITMILLPISCFGMFAYIILLQEAMAEQAAWLNQFSMQATGIVMEVMIGIAVLALGLGLAAILSGSQRKGLAIAGTVMSAIVLVSWIGFILLMTIIQLTSQPGVVPSTG